MSTRRDNENIRSFEMYNPVHMCVDKQKYRIFFSIKINASNLENDSSGFRLNANQKTQIAKEKMVSTNRIVSCSLMCATHIRHTHYTSIDEQHNEMLKLV